MFKKRDCWSFKQNVRQYENLKPAENRRKIDNLLKLCVSGARNCKEIKNIFDETHVAQCQDGSLRKYQKAIGNKVKFESDQKHHSGRKKTGPRQTKKKKEATFLSS